MYSIDMMENDELKNPDNNPINIDEENINKQLICHQQSLTDWSHHKTMAELH